jgi:hypothetical protein
MKISASVLVLLAASVMVVSCTGGGNKQASVAVAGTGNDTASIHFRELTHDFGKITEGEKVAHVFTFENRGTGPLIISSASTSCGCTVPKYDRKPIEPGTSGTLEVVFDSSGRNGRQTKTITVSSNATRPVILLTITGEVIMSNNNK